MIIVYLFFISFSYAKGFTPRIDYDYYYDNDYESHVQDLSRKENEHEASSENVELDDNCLKRTRPIMSNIMDKIEEMKDCFLKPRGSIATMTIGSMSPCTARLEETVLKALYHDPGESQEGHLIIALLFDCDVYFSRAYHWMEAVVLVSSQRRFTILIENLPANSLHTPCLMTSMAIHRMGQMGH